jgi:hypothetical protein
MSILENTKSSGNNCRSCDTNLTGDNSASQYQRQKIIQNTVRVASSLYTMNLAGLSGYQAPLLKYQIIEQDGTPYIAPPKVYWNQMSDRAKPANQVVKTGSGSTYHGSSTRHTIVRNRPGAMSPGGIGVDIKHNSYDRYLNKLKGKAPLRRGVVPENFGLPIVFNREQPIYGGKTIKTSIINGCNCPNISDNLVADNKIYGSQSNAIQDKILSVTYKFNVGDFVWAKKYNLDTKLYKAQIINIINNVYTIKFTDDNSIVETLNNNLYIYFDCNCSYIPSIEEEILNNQNSITNLNESANATSELACYTLSQLTQAGII